MQKIAAIDAGSNAIRMIVGNVNEAWQVEPIENIRLPVRLGQDVFASGSLREKTIQQATDAFLHFQRVAQDLGVEKTRAKNEAAGSVPASATPPMQRAALARDTSRVNDISVEGKEISVFWYFPRPPRIRESQLSRSKSSNQ